MKEFCIIMVITAFIIIVIETTGNNSYKERDLIIQNLETECLMDEGDYTPSTIKRINERREIIDSLDNVLNSMYKIGTESEREDLLIQIADLQNVKLYNDVSYILYRLDSLFLNIN